MPLNRPGRLLFAVLVLTLLLIIGRNLYQRYLDGVLIASVESSNMSPVRELLARGADPNCFAYGVSKRPVLLLAMSLLTNHQATAANAISPAESIVCLLIEKGSDVSSAEQEPCGYLHQACRIGTLEVVRCLMEHGANPNATIFHQSVFNAALGYGTNEYPLPHVATPDAPAFVTNEDTTWAEKERRHEVSRQMVQMLRQHGLRLSVSQAVEIGDMATLKTLLDAGVSADNQEANAEPALWEATRRDNVEAVQMLLAHGFNVNAHKEYGTTPLFIAAGKGNIPLMQILLTHGADVNLRRNGGVSNTPLYAAVQAGKVEVVKLLLVHGAMVNRKSPHGHTLLYSARRRGAMVIAALLLKGGGKEE